MSSVIIFYWTKVILLSAVVGLVVAIPVDYYSSELIGVRSFGRTPDGFLARDPSSHPLSRPRRAPWAPSLTRSGSYFRKAMDIMGRAEGSKRSVHREDDMSLPDLANLLRYLNQRRNAEPVDSNADATGFGEPADEANLGRNRDEILVGPADVGISPEAFGRWRQNPISPEAFARWRENPKRAYEGMMEVRIEGEAGDPEGKRGGGGVQDGGRPLYIGFGQHAANAAIDAFEGILDEGKSEKQERLQNPVRFLG